MKRAVRTSHVKSGFTLVAKKENPVEDIIHFRGISSYMILIYMKQPFMLGK